LEENVKSKRKTPDASGRNALRCLLANTSGTYAFARYLLSTSKQAKEIHALPHTPQDPSQDACGRIRQKC